MKRSLISVALVIAACGGSGARGVSWEDTTPLSGAVEPGAAPDGAAALRLTGPGTHPLIVLDDPGVDGEYVITGMVSYEGVTAGYLEMWSVFGESRYFTRTLAESGELGVLRGDSEWRPFALPFFAAPGTAPTSLEINLVLDGPGTVWIGPLGVAGATTAGGGSVKWGLVGAIAGTTVGMLGAFTITGGAGRSPFLPCLASPPGAGVRRLGAGGHWLRRRVGSRLPAPPDRGGHARVADPVVRQRETALCGGRAEAHHRCRCSLGHDLLGRLSSAAIYCF
jgi:hypothetical protein